jgi:hypothetical protein
MKASALQQARPWVPAKGFQNLPERNRRCEEGGRFLQLAGWKFQEILSFSKFWCHTSPFPLPSL